MAKYVSILALEERHNVTFDSAYCNSNACGDFIDCIGDELMNNLKGFLEKAKFYSILFDGTTDKSAAEKESFFVLYLDKDTDAEKVEVKLSFLGLSDIHHAHAVGVKQSIDDVFVHVGLDDYRNQLVGLGADGASVNVGHHNGVKALIMTEEMEWLVFVWCMAHRLELAVKDALGKENIVFKKIDDMLTYILFI